MGTWVRALVLALVDLAVLYFLVRRLSPARFRELRWPLVAASALVWSVLVAALLWGFWDLYYRYFYAEWTRWAFLVAGIEYALVALLLWWLAQRLPGNPAVNFCLLGGLESVPEHLYGIYFLGILKLPALQGETAGSILAFAVPEYILYWSAVLGFALVLDAAWKRMKRPAGSQPSARRGVA